MNKTKAKSTPQFKSPNPVIYFIFAMLGKFLLKILFNHKIEKRVKLEKNKPYIFISNHASVLDVVMMMATVYPARFSILTGRDAFTMPIIKVAIKLMRGIPKNQFAIDIPSIRIIKSIIDDNRSVAIYPEGKVSLDGTNLHYLPIGIGKLMKMLNAEVIITKVYGSNLAKPRWFKGLKFGNLKTVMDRVISFEEIKTLSNQEIYDRIRESIQFNDNIYQQENKLRFRSKKPALGYEYAYYKCPKCGVEYQMTTTNTHINCSACGNSIQLNEYGELIPVGDSKTFARLDLWYDYQRQSCREELLQDNFYIETPCKCFFNDVKANEYKEVGEGIAYIDKEKIGYKGTYEGKPYEFSTPLKILHTITTKNEEGIDLTNDQGILRLDFIQNKYSTKFGLLVEEYYRLTVIEKT